MFRNTNIFNPFLFLKKSLNDFNNKTITGNGLRIKKIIDVDSNISYTRTFKYQKDNGLSSGSVINVPQFSYITPWRSIKYLKDQHLYEEVNNTKYRIAFPSYINEGSANWSSTEKYDITTVRFAFPTNSVLNEYRVFYSRIIEESDYFQGKRIYNYITPEYFQPLTDAKHRIRPSGSPIDDDPIHETSNAEFGHLPYIPSAISRHDLSSLPKSIEYKNTNNTVVYKRSFNYDSTIVSSRKLLGLKYSPLEGARPFQGPSSLVTPYMVIWHLFSKYYIMNDINKFLSTENIEEIFSTGSISHHKSYQYNNKNYVKKESWKDSKGDLYEMYYKYVCDFNNTINAPSGSDAYYLKTLNTLNRIKEPVEMVLFKNGKPISGEIYKYKKYGESIHLSEKKTFETDNTNTPYQFASFSGTALEVDSRYEETEYYDLYDSNGNLLQKHVDKGITTSYLYGYNGKYLIAELSNVSYNSIPKSLLDSITSTTNENTLLGLLNQLRDLFPDGHISTNTYIPFIDKSTETDERNNTKYYEYYDDSHRLKTVRNREKNLIKEYQYHYKMQ